MIDENDLIVWPKVSATRADQEPWRLTRLERLAGVLLGKDEAMFHQIVELHDHKGTLTVTWKNDIGKIYLVGWAWQDVFNEDRDNVVYKAAKP